MTDMLMTDAATTTEGNASQGAPGAATTDTAAAAQAAGDQAAASEAQQQQAAAAGDSKPGTETGGDKSKGDDKAAQGAPEKYEFKAPEGAQLNEAVLGAFSEVAKDLNLTQDVAQQILDKVAPMMANQQAEAVKNVRTQWLESAKTDQEFGGDKLAANLAVAQKALAQFGTPELKTLLQESGLGNHPEIIRAFYRAGKAISEDGFVAGGRSAPNTDDPAKRLFPNQA